MTEYIERASSFSQGPLALIIGCGDMGMSCARMLGRRAPLLIVDVDGERLERSVAALQHEGYTVAGQRCDITSEGDIDRLAGTLRAGPGVRMLAHVAAVGDAPGGWRVVLDVDLLGPHRIVRAVEPYMVSGGVAILVSSTGAYRCPDDVRLRALLDEPFAANFFAAIVDVVGHEPDFLEAYFMAKQGMNRLARKLAIAWGEREVRVLSVSPGLIDSTMGRTGGAMLPVYDGQGQETRRGTRAEKATKEVPLGRQGKLIEVVAAIDFLASDAASFINGIDVPVDGGASAMWQRHGELRRLK